MAEPVWNPFLTERDKAVFAAAGFGACAGFGKRPALFVIDVSWAFCGDKPEPILESIKRWRTSCGEEGWLAITYIRALIDKAHDRGIPVIYTTNACRADGWDFTPYTWKRSRSDAPPKEEENRRGRNEIVDIIAPAPQDIVIHKQKPSAFFGTCLTSYLALLGCDSVVVTGATTSGCVRATVVDAFSFNLRVALAEEACFDRSQASHAITLCDMHAKYADVVKTAEVLSFFDGIPRGAFDLPLGGPPASST